MQLSSKTYRWDVEEIKDTYGNTQKFFTIYDWEVFGAVTVYKTDDEGNEKTYKFDKAYLESIVESARKEQDGNYFLPVHTKHQDKDSNGSMVWINEPAGVAKGIKLGELDGEPVIVVAEWTKIPEHIFNGIIEYRWKYRSVEIKNFEKKRISSIAILDIEPPEFKLPITEINISDKEIPKPEDIEVPCGEHVCSTFNEKDEMSLCFSEQKMTLTKKPNKKEPEMKKKIVKKQTESEGANFAEEKNDKQILDEKDLDKDEITDKKKKEVESTEKAKDDIKMGDDYQEDKEKDDEENDDDYVVEDDTEETDGNDDFDFDDDTYVEPDDDEGGDELLTVVMEFTDKVAKVDAKMDTLIALMSGKPAEQPQPQQSDLTEQTGNPMPLQMSENTQEIFTMAERQKDAIEFMELRNTVEKTGFNFDEVDGVNMYQDSREFSREAIGIIEEHKGTKAELASKIIKMAENHIGFEEYHEKSVPESAAMSFSEIKNNEVMERVPKDMRKIPGIAKHRRSFEQLHPGMMFSEDEKSQNIFREHVRHETLTNK